MSSRRAPLTMTLGVIIATTLILPWTLDYSRLPGHGAGAAVVPSAGATKVARLPLPGIGPGMTVRELTQDEPFSMVALTATDLTGTSVRIRAELADGHWGPWYRTAHEVDSHIPGSRRRADVGHAGGHLSGTEPVYVGNTTRVQISITRSAGAASPERIQSPARSKARLGHDLGYVPVTVETPLTQGVSAVLISPPKTPNRDIQRTPPSAVTAPGQPPQVIPRAQWGAPESNRCGYAADKRPIRAAVVHHTAGNNSYAPEDSAAIVRAIHAYHTRILGWCDIGYNALIDRYGQVFEGRAGGLVNPVTGAHAGGFNRDTWGVSMIGTFDRTMPPAIQLHTVGLLLGWRLGLDRTDPLGSAELHSAGSSFTSFRRGVTINLPVIIGHRDVDKTECPGDGGYAALEEIRRIASRFKSPSGARDIVRSLQGTAILARWQGLGAMNSVLGAPRSPESFGVGRARYALFDRGAVYWSPGTGAQPVTGAIYDAWAALGYERSALGLPTSTEIPEPEWVVQNFQHGTLNFDRASGTVHLVTDGVVKALPPIGPDGPPTQLERFSPVIDDASDQAAEPPAAEPPAAGPGSDTSEATDVSPVESAPARQH